MGGSPAGRSRYGCDVRWGKFGTTAALTGALLSFLVDAPFDGSCLVVLAISRHHSKPFIDTQRRLDLGSAACSALYLLSS